MGMVGAFWRVTPGDVQRLSQASAEEVRDYLFGAQPKPKRQKGVLGWLKSMSPIQVESHEEYLDALQARSSARAELDVDKAWHGLHFLFTGTAWEGEEPACFIVEGGSMLGADADDEALPRVLSPAQVSEFASFLQRLSRDELTRRYNPARMTELEIYPEIWNREDEVEENLEYLLDYYERLRDFVVAARAEGDQVVVMVT